MAKVTETEITVYQGAAKNYAEAAKNVVTALLSNIPDLTFDSVITDTTSAYRVRCLWKGKTDFVIEFYNSSYSFYARLMYNNGQTYTSGLEMELLDRVSSAPRLTYGNDNVNIVRITTEKRIWVIGITDKDRDYSKNDTLILTTLADRISGTTIPAIGSSYNSLQTYYQNQIYSLGVQAPGAALLTSDDNYYAVPIILRNSTVPISGKIAGSDDYYEVFLRQSKFSIGNRTRFSVGGTAFYSFGSGDICVKEA